MEISDIRVKLMDNAADRLKAVCSVTFDGEFVVRDLKVVDGTNGLFVAMPSRKLAVHCPSCRHKNHLRAHFCNECGGKLPPSRVSADANGRIRLHRDIAHPINPEFREMVQSKVIERYEAERELASQPGYKPADVDAELDEMAEPHDAQEAPVVASELTEYDALIAGLRSGPGAPRPAPESPRPSPRPQAPARRPARSDRGPSRPEDESQRRPSPTPAASRDQGPEEGFPRQPVRRPAPASVNEDEWPLGKPDAFDEKPAPVSARQMFSSDASPLPAKPIVERPPAKPSPKPESRPATPQPKFDDDAPFGAGIL